MAEVATDILHNVGNVLNSVNVSVTLLHERQHETVSTGLEKLAALLSDHEHDLATFITQDKRGRQIPNYIQQLSRKLRADRDEQTEELGHLRHNIDHIKDIVAMQQNYAQVSGYLENVAASEVMDQAVRINTSAMERHHIEVQTAYSPIPNLTVEKHKLLQILINLIGNAKYALNSVPIDKRCIRLGIESHATDRVRMTVTDSGAGNSARESCPYFHIRFYHTQRRTRVWLAQWRQCSARNGGLFERLQRRIGKRSHIYSGTTFNGEGDSSIASASVDSATGSQDNRICMLNGWKKLNRQEHFSKL